MLRRGEERAAGARYRTFDEQGAVLALRSDMTIPIARVVATRYADAEPPLRFSYFARAWRATERGVGEPREFLQGGVELIGVPGAEGEAEVVALAIAALDEAGLRRHRVGIGDGALYRSAAQLARRVRGRFTCRCWRACRGATSWASSTRWTSSAWARASATCSCGCPRSEAAARCSTARRGGPPGRADGAALEGLRALHELLSERGVADRVIFDLGLVRELGYYTGAVFEVYDPAVGFALGGGGRYDELIGRFGRDLPACGIALDVQRVHLAQAAEEALG